MGSLLPYSLLRTWHIQLAIIWIATCFVGAGIFIGPFVSGREPKKQWILSTALFSALEVVSHDLPWRREGRRSHRRKGMERHRQPPR